MTNGGSSGSLADLGLHKKHCAMSKTTDTIATPTVGILMGSDSDWPTMKQATDALAEFGLTWEARVHSAHRTPEDVADYARSAHSRGIKVIIAGAGGAAHLAGVVAALSPLPVIAVPIESPSLKGLDSLLSMVQMPSGIPVATVAIGGAYNAGVLAAHVLAASDAAMREKVLQFKVRLAEKARGRDRKLQEQIRQAAGGTGA
jgi:5-(carboxyamino)imidazole ribonucleotide mutase